MNEKNNKDFELNDEQMEQITGGFSKITTYYFSPGDCFTYKHTNIMVVGDYSGGVSESALIDVKWSTGGDAFSQRMSASHPAFAAENYVGCNVFNF